MGTQANRLIVMVRLALCFLTLLSSATAFLTTPAWNRPRMASKVLQTARPSSISMGWLDAAFANEDLGPQGPAGLSKAVEEVTVTFKQNGKTVKSYPGESMKIVAKRAGVKVLYDCSKGDCGSCEMKFNNRKIRTCVAKVPKGKSFTCVGIPGK